eukprot:820646_1
MNPLGVMFRFAEIVRKFILEKKHLEDDVLWPYYKNYFHRNDHQSYHRLVNTFNLSLMFGRSDMFELLEESQDTIADNNSNAGCFNHFSSFNYRQEEKQFDEPVRLKLKKSVAVRRQRKVAARLLLQSWDSLRNVNILRHQLSPLLRVVMVDVNETLQRKQIEIAQKYDKQKWKQLIERTNMRLQENLNNIETGWQLTDYDINSKIDSMEISTTQYPFFESFLQHFLLNTIHKETNQVRYDLATTDA